MVEWFSYCYIYHKKWGGGWGVGVGVGVWGCGTRLTMATAMLSVVHHGLELITGKASGLSHIYNITQKRGATDFVQKAICPAFAIQDNISTMNP